MRSTLLRATTATVAATTLLLAGCATAADDDATAATPGGTEESTEESADEGTDEDGGTTGPADVPDVTLLILETAEGNLARAGLTAEVVDADGQAVATDDATAWKVVAQDPEDGTLEAGEAVVLTVEPRG